MRHFAFHNIAENGTSIQSLTLTKLVALWVIYSPTTHRSWRKWLSLVQLKTELYTSIWGLSLKIFSLSHSSFKRRSYFIPTSSIPCACLLACLFVVGRSTCLSLSFLLYIYLFCFGACFLVVSVVSLFVLPFTFFYGISNFFLFFFFFGYFLIKFGIFLKPTHQSAPE